MKFQGFLGETREVAKVFDGSHVELREDCHRTWRAKLDRARVLRGSLLKLSHCGGGRDGGRCGEAYGAEIEAGAAGSRADGSYF